MATQFPFFPRTPQRSAPFNVDQTFQQAIGLHRGGQLQGAAQLYRQILQRHPAHAGSLHMLGVVALSSGAYPDAVRLLTDTVRLLPNDAGARVNLALALAESGQASQALAYIDEALALQPAMPAAAMNRVAILVKAGRHEEALKDAEALAATGHNHPELLVNQGIALLELQRPQEAAVRFELALQAAPRHVKALNNLAKALLAQERFPDALEQVEKVLAIQADYPDALCTKAQALSRLGEKEQAELLLRNAIQVQSTPATLLLLGHASCLLELKRPSEAIGQVERALAQDPNSAEAYVCGGRALAALGRPEDAIANFDKALDIDPRMRTALHERAASAFDTKRFQQAINDLEECGADPMTILPVRMQICDWKDFEKTCERVATFATNHQRNPFYFLSMLDEPSAHLAIAKAHLQALGLREAARRTFPQRTASTKIRIGYFSADLFNHATIHLMAELFASHDPHQFEVHALSYGPQRHDAATDRVKEQVHGFHDVSGLTDTEAANFGRSLALDIAVDLKGFTKDGRLGIFAERCAPVQVSYLGYPGTTGASYMDYVIADITVLPPEQQSFYTEKPVYMPYSYQVNDSQRMISPRVFTRAELGLPEDAFVFCCFNNNYKILPDTFASWMRILHAAPASVLWLFQDTEAAAHNLRNEARNRGIDPSRLVFAPRLPADEHLARHRAADLFIDTLPYNAHTTASDALWAGLPVLTLAGRSFAARVAASLLTAVGLPELITTSQAEYEAKAIHLATHPDELKALRQRLQVQRLTSPLFDGKRFTRDLETAYRMMLERYEAGLPPETLTVPTSA